MTKMTTPCSLPASQCSTPTSLASTRSPRLRSHRRRAWAISLWSDADTLDHNHGLEWAPADHVWWSPEENFDDCEPSGDGGAPEGSHAVAHTLVQHLDHQRNTLFFLLSSPRAESAKAFTGRRNSHSGRGEDFLSRQPNFFTETAVTPERKVEKSFPRWENNRNDKG